MDIIALFINQGDEGARVVRAPERRGTPPVHPAPPRGMVRTPRGALVVIVLGTEDSIERGRVSGLLARYALNAFYTGVEETESGTTGQTVGELPTNAEAAVNLIIRTAKKKR